MKITVGIPTKNRPEHLDRCLLSIKNNSLLPNEIIIVDNSPGRESVRIVTKYKHLLPIKIYFEKKSGIPYVRNTILKKACKDILVFIDDDTELPQNFFKNISISHISNSKVIAIQGKSISLPKKSLVASILDREHDNWIQKNLKNKFLTIIDTKNVSLKLKKLKKLNFNFDISLAALNRGEDVDMANFLISNNEKILFYPKIFNFHYENTNLSILFEERIRSGRAKFYLERKWKRMKMYREANKHGNKKQSLVEFGSSIFLLKIPYYFGYVFEYFKSSTRGIIKKNFLI